MPLGNQNQNFSNKNQDNNKKNYEPNVYSPVQFKNPNGVDPSELSFAFWNRMLKITISPKKDSKPGDKFDTYDHENNISIHINHVKARILCKEIDEFLKDPDKINSIGINSGAAGLLTISNGKEFGINAPVMVVRKMDEAGKVLTSYAYQFNANDYYNSIRNFDEKSLKYDTVAMPNLELIIFQDLLQAYYESANYAMAYTVVDSMKFDMSRTNSKLDLLLDNAGIKRQGGNGGNAGGGKSFFQRSNELDSDTQGSSRNTSNLDDLASELEGLN
jgi:hypothetical protein